jgi:cell division protein FtsB
MAAAKRRASKRPQSRAERLRRARRRRTRFVIGASVAVSLLILGAWFPLGSLMHQRAELASTSSQLQQLEHQDHILSVEKAQLSNQAVVARISRQVYQMVASGQRAFRVLPSNGETDAASDPGFQRLADPTRAAEVPPGSVESGGTGSGTGSAGSAGSAGSGATSSTTTTRTVTDRPAPSQGFVSRVLRTLEFWR